MTNLNNLNLEESTNQTSKSSKFIENTQKAVRDVLMKAWIGVNSLLPMAPATTSTVVPASVNTITAVAPMATTIKAISLWTAAGLLTACGGGEDWPDTPIDTKDTIAPTINVSQSTMDVTWWKQIRIDWNQLYIWDILVASRSDNKTANCKVTLSFNWQSISSWTTLSEEWTLSIKVSDAEWNNKNVDIKLTAQQDISWLESLKNLNIQVDQEVNLLSWITMGNWAQLVKTEIEIDGQKVEISDPTHYTPEYPSTCSIILTVKDKNWEDKEYRVDDLTIKPLDYTEATIDEANMINEKYPWYNNLQQSTQDFIYPHLLSSYAACNWSQLDNRVHIIMGETPAADDVENIWTLDDYSDHAYEWYYRIRAISPDATIKWCLDYDDWGYLERYVNQHPDKTFIISCAADTWWWNTRENLYKNQHTHTLKEILKQKNVIWITANGNRTTRSRKVYNENIKNGNRYNSGSINSELNNKITVVWYNSWWEGNNFSPDEFWWQASAMPIWYEKDKWNILIPMINLIRSDNKEHDDTASSFPTAVTSGVIWNAISIIMAAHPWITAEDAMTIICDNYLREETFQYKDKTTNWALVDWWKRYFIQMQDLLNNELLQTPKIQNLQFSSDSVELPNGQWLCYTWVWIQFEYEWKKYMTTDANQSILNQALKSWKVKWYWDKTLSKKCGWKDSAKFNVYIVDKEWKRIPDLHLQIDKPIN